MKTTAKMDPVSLVLAASVSNFNFQQRNSSLEEYKEVDRGTRCVICSWIYLPVHLKWEDQALNRTTCSTEKSSAAPGVYLNTALNLDFGGGGREKSERFPAAACVTFQVPSCIIEILGQMAEAFCQMSCNLNVKLKKLNELLMLCLVPVNQNLLL